MRVILQLCVVLLLLVGVGNHVWGKMDVGEKALYGDFFAKSESEPGAEWLWDADGTRDAAPWGYDIALDVRDGPNLYAYCVQNPWTSFDPEGLATAEERQAHSGIYAGRVGEYQQIARQEEIYARENFTGRKDVYRHHKEASESARSAADDAQHRAAILANADEGNYRQMMFDAYGINHPNLNQIAAYYANQFNDQATVIFVSNQRPATPEVLMQQRWS